MEENNQDIQRLIKLKKQRPSFSRLISWEMSKATDTQYRKKIKQKEKQKLKSDQVHTSDDNLDDTYNDGDDYDDDVKEETDSGSAVSSDYETANEDVKDELELSEAISSINTRTTFDTVDVADEDDLNSEEEDDADDAFETIANESASGELHPVRRRRLSKRQKRKRSKLFRVTYIDEFANLADLYNMDDDIKTAVTDVSENVDSIDICCPVPTLAELCLKATRQRRKRNQSGQNTSTNTPLPIGIKRIIKDWRFNQEILDKQLSFMLNFVLPSCCDEGNIKQANVYYRSYKVEYWLRLPIRSVWSSASHPTKKNSFQYPSETPSAFLYNPTMRRLPKDIFQSIRDYYEQEFYERLVVSSTHVQSALATTIDLMLPSTLSDSVRHRSCSTDSEVIESASKNAVSCVKRALRFRYPHVVDHLFDRVLPYMMWARGNIGQATQMFQVLVDKETNSQYKAMYLSEIACMHSMFGETSTAVSFYKLASEVTVAEEDISKKKIIAEVTEQTQVLLANVYACGLLTQEKACKSVQHWETAVSLDTPKMATVFGAVNSYFGLQAYHLAGDCWSEAEGRLRSWLGSNKYLHYYLALVLALKGNGPESTQEFRALRSQSTAIVPGEIVLPYLAQREKENPLNPLITIVKGQRTQVKPLKVVWRTQLRPPRLTHEKPMEADISSPALNLCISENGHLTGDMQLLMPPIRQVELDLFTGSLVLSNIPSFTGTWHTMQFPEDGYLISGFMVPTQYQIYSHENGTQVHLVAPSLMPPNRATASVEIYMPRCPMILTWKGPDGRTARINLVTVAKDMCKKRLDKELVETKREFSELKENFLQHLVDVAYARNLTLSYDRLEKTTTAIFYKLERTKEIPKEMQQRSNVPKDWKKGKYAKSIKSVMQKHLRNHLPRFSIDVRKEPFQYGKGLVLLLKIQLEVYMMFIDTSSRENFLDFKLVPDHHKIYDWIDQSRPGTNCTDADYFMAYKGDSELSIYNEKGEDCSINIKQLCRNFHPNKNIHLCILREYVFGVTKDRLSVWRHTVGSEFHDVCFKTNIAISLTPYWELEDCKKQIENLIAMGREKQGKGHFLFLHMSMGLGFMDPDTQEMISVSLPEECSLKLTDDSKVILGRFEECTVHKENFFTRDDTAICRFAVTTENKLFLFDMSHKLGSDQLQATVLCYLFLPGKVKEVCIIGKEAGLLVSITQHHDSDTNYREHVLHFHNDGFLYGTLLCLGRGPHSFCPVYLHGNKDRSSEPGWYVYMRDGHDGILAVKLF